MMQATEEWNGDDFAFRRRLDLAWDWGVSLQRVEETQFRGRSVDERNGEGGRVKIVEYGGEKRV